MPATVHCHCDPADICDWCQTQIEQHQDRINEAREESDMQAMEMRYEDERDRWFG